MSVSEFERLDESRALDVRASHVLRDRRVNVS
jgi:hypothetical protein